jgi:hypothetical protein
VVFPEELGEEVKLTDVHENAGSSSTKTRRNDQHGKGSKGHALAEGRAGSSRATSKCEQLRRLYVHAVPILLRSSDWG